MKIYRPLTRLIASLVGTNVFGPRHYVGLRFCCLLLVHLTIVERHNILPRYCFNHYTPNLVGRGVVASFSQKRVSWTVPSRPMGINLHADHRRCKVCFGVQSFWLLMPVMHSVCYDYESVENKQHSGRKLYMRPSTSVWQPNSIPWA